MALMDVDWSPNASKLRMFCLTGVAILGGLAALAWHKAWGAPWLPWVLVAAAAWCLVGAAWPKLSAPLYLFVTAVTFPIGLLVSYAMLGVIFYGLLTPVGLFFRMIGRDPLHRRLDPDAETYWVTRDSGADAARYFRQF